MLKEICVKFKLLILSFMLLMLNACGSSNNSTNIEKINKTTTQLPVELQKLAFSTEGTLNAYITIDGDTANRKIMTIDRVNGSSATVSIGNLSLNVHDISISYEFTTLGGETYILADASKAVDLSSGVANLSFTSADYVFDRFDEDGDTVSNAKELIIGSSPVIANPHLFISPTDISMEENTIFTGYNAVASAIDGDSVVFNLSSINGQDNGLFNIDSTTGQLTFKIAADFEVPTDVDKDNIYEVSITASDGTNTIVQDIRITVNSIDGRPFITTWKTDNPGVTNDNQIKISTLGSGYNYTIDWGDQALNSSSRSLRKNT